MDYSKAAKSGKPTTKTQPQLQRGPPLPRPPQTHKAYWDPHSSKLPDSGRSNQGSTGYSTAVKSGKPTTPVRSPVQSPSRPQKFQKSSEYQTPFAMRPERSGFSGRTTSQTAENSPHHQSYQRPLRNPPTFGANRNQLNLRKIEEEALTDEAKRKIVEEKLEHSQSPFVWKPCQVKPYDDPKANFLRLQDKAKEIEEKRPFQWRHFILDLVMGYELFRMGEVDRSMERIKKLESTLRHLEETMETRKDWMFGVIKESLWQVVYGSLTYLHLARNELDQAYQLASVIKRMDDLWKQAKAGMHGIRAAVSMEFGHRGNKIAAAEAIKAVSLDYSIGEWHFIVAKSLARLRRVAQCHEEVSAEETKAISKAINLDKQNPYYMIHNAQLIRERAFRVYAKDPFEYKELDTKKERKQQREEKKAYSKSDNVKKIMNLFHAARYRYHEALKLQPENSRMLVRVAFGLMKMPNFFVDLKLISECVEKAVQLAPNNPMVHHVQGMYYERFYTEPDQVTDALTKSLELNNFGSGMDLVKVNYKLKQTDIVEQLEALAERFSEPHKLQVVFAQQGSYQLFIKRDLVEAVKCYGRVLDIDVDSYALKSHKPLFFPVKKPLNMFSVLIEEIGKRTLVSSFPSEQRKILVNFRIRIMKHDKEESEPRLGIKEILEMSRVRGRHLNRYRERELRREVEGKRPRPKWVYRERKNKKQKTSDVNKENEKDNKEASGQKSSFSTKYGKPQSPGSSLDRSRRSSVSSVDSDYTRDSTIHGERFTWGATGCTAAPAFVPDAKSLFAKARRHSSSSSCVSRDSSVSSACSEAAGSKGTHRSRYSGESGLIRDNLLKHESELQGGMSRMSLDEDLPRELYRGMSVMSLDRCSLTDEFEKLSVWDRVKQSYENMDHIKNNPLRKSESSQTLNKGKGKRKGKGRGKPMQRSDSTQSLNVPQNKTPINLSLEGYKSAFGSQDSFAGSSRSLSFMPAFARKNCDNEGQ